MTLNHSHFIGISQNIILSRLLFLMIQKIYKILLLKRLMFFMNILLQIFKNFLKIKAEKSS
jgi:hypothetical protein